MAGTHAQMDPVTGHDKRQASRVYRGVKGKRRASDIVSAKWRAFSLHLRGSKWTYGSKNEAAPSLASAIEFKVRSNAEHGSVPLHRGNRTGKQAPTTASRRSEPPNSGNSEQGGDDVGGCRL